MKVGEFITLLEQVKLKNSVYKDLKWQQGYIPHHKQEMEQLVDALGKHKVVRWLSNVSYYSQRQSHGKLGVLALCLWIGSFILYSQIKGGEKQWQEILVLTSLSLALSTFAVYCWWPKLISLFLYKEIEIYKKGVKIMEQDVELMDYCIVKGKEKTAEEYVESIKGAVSAAEFSMHTRYLLSLSSYAYDNYELELRKSSKFKTGLKKRIIEDFLSYVRLKRQTRENSEKDIDSLYYCDKRSDKQGIEDAYDKLFRYTKTLLWHVQPYQSHYIKPIDSFYRRVKYLNGNVTLRRALERVCVLYDDPDKILRGLKGLLVVYHTDKNKDENAREVYEKVELVYKAVNTILKEYEKYYGDTIFCNFEIFLGKKLQDINEDEVYEEIISTYKTLGMKEYLDKEHKIADIRDNILRKYRKLITVENAELEKKIQYLNLKEGKALERRAAEGMNILSKGTKEIIKELEDLNKKLMLQVEEMSEISSTVKERCNNEIEKQSCVLTNDGFSQYYQQKKIESLKKKLKELEKEQKEIGAFLIRLKGRNILNMLKDFGLIGALRSNIRSMSKYVRNYETAKNVFSLDTEYDYVSYYSELYAKYWKMGEEIKSYKVKPGKDGRLVFYKKVLKRQEGSYSDSLNNAHEIIIDFDAELENLRLESDRLNKKFKTRQEIKEECRNNLLVTKDMKRKSVETKQRIEQLKSKSETFERRAEKAEVKLGETEVKLGETEAKAEEAEAEKKAVIIVMEEAERREIFLKDAKKFFIEQFKLVILYGNLKNKFQNLSHEYINLRRELGEDIANNKVSNMKRIFDKMSGLATKLNKLDKRFNQKKQEEERCIQQSFSNENIEKFRCDVLQKVMQTREELECGIGVVEEEKLKVEQMIMDQQRIENIPDSNMSEAEAQSHQNTISKIA